MQQLWGVGVVFYRCEEYACLQHEIDYVRISLTRVKYWNEIRDVLVPILHGVKFTKCELYGSTRLSLFYIIRSKFQF